MQRSALRSAVRAAAAPARGAVAPKTGAHGEAAASHHGHHGVSKDISPEMQKYLNTQAFLFNEKVSRSSLEPRIGC